MGNRINEQYQYDEKISINKYTDIEHVGGIKSIRHVPHLK
jgi:hypothetical protein